jgi:phosphoribosyl 1,2-cyclic phosphate phosphodiesterase
MKIKYLGTGASEGFPGIFCQCEACGRARSLGGKNLRRRSSALIDGSLLVDIPPDLYGLSLLHGVDLSQIKHIAVTHTHEDHFYLHELSNFAPPFAHRSGEAVKFYGSCAVHDAFVRMYEGKLDGLVEMIPLEPFRPVTAGGHVLTPLPASHGAPNSLIYIVESNGQRLLYANDTGWFSDAVWDYLRGKRFDIVSMDCTSIVGEVYSTHMNLNQNILLRERLLQMGSADERTVFVATHFSHNGLLMQHEMEERFAPYGIRTAYDGFETEV